ncbi:MAG: POTRA domain-containing protein [bacterium]
MTGGRQARRPHEPSRPGRRPIGLTPGDKGTRPARHAPWVRLAPAAASRALFPLLVLLAWPASAAESPEGKKITEIRFVYREAATGSERPVRSPSPRALAQNVRLKVGAAFSSQAARADRDELITEHGLACREVRPELVPGGVRVTYVFQPSPRIWSIRIAPDEGAPGVATTELMEKAVTLRQDDRVTPGRLEADRRRIVRHLRGQGYYFATVRAWDRPVPGRVGYATLHFRVDRGPKVQPQKITITGNAEIADDRLRDLMETDVDTFWTSRRFAEGVYQADVKAIEGHYVARGWKDATVTARPTLFHPEEVVVRVRHAERAGRRVVTSLRVAGAETVSGALIRQRFLTRPGRTFSEDRLRRDLRWLAARYYRHGLAALPDDITVETAGNTTTARAAFGLARETVVIDITVDDEGRAGRVRCRTTGPFTNRQVAEHIMLAAGDPVTTTAVLRAVRDVARFYARPAERPRSAAPGTSVRYALVDYRQSSRADRRRAVLEFVRRPAADGSVAAHLRIHVDEGPRYRVGEITFTGIESMQETHVRDRLRMTSGSVYSPQGLARDASAVRRTFQEMGYADVEVDESAKARPEQPFFDVHYDVTPGPVYYINVVRISGNDKTRATVIEREMELGKEELGPERFDVRKIARRAQRLRDTGYFDQVKVTPVPSPRREDGKRFKDLHVQVREGVTRRFFVGAGAGSKAGVFADIRLRDINFDINDPPRSWSDFVSGKAYTGGGQRFDLYARVGSGASECGVQWHEPWLGDRPVELGVNAGFRTEDRDEYDLDRLLGEVTLGKRFGRDQQVTAYLKLRAHRADVNSIDRNAPPDVWDDRGKHTILGLTAGLTRSALDRRTFPTEGSQYTVAAELLGDALFDAVKLRAEGRVYKTVYEATDKTRHVVSFWGGVASILGAEPPVFERLYAGGLGSVRGFEPYSISPRNNRIYAAPPGGPKVPVVGDGDPIGGRFRITGGVEYLFPIIKDRLRGVVFVDAGSVADQSLGIGDALGDLRVSTGIGAQLTHFGQIPIAVYLAVPLKKESGDDTQAVSFTIGFHWP